MIKHNQDGAVSGVLISLIFTVILLLAAIGFGFWAFASRQDYKDNSDSKADAAVQAAVAQNSSKKDKQFAEEAKNPLKTYNGPEALGSVAIQFPKTWSGYVDSDDGGDGLDIYFAPGTVPPINDKTSVFALRVQVVNQAYSDMLKTFQSQQQAGLLTVSAYSLPKLPKIVGVKVNGQLPGNSATATMVVLPLRSQTLQIETDGTQFLNDFNTYILPNFSFSP